MLLYCPANWTTEPYWPAFQPHDDPDAKPSSSPWWLVDGGAGDPINQSRSPSGSSASDAPVTIQEEVVVVIKAPDAGCGSGIRSLVAAMLTLLAAWMVLRNLFGWHKSLGACRRKISPSCARHPRHVWQDAQEWVDYDADDSDSHDGLLATTADDDSEPLFIVAKSSPLSMVMTVAQSEEEDEDMSVMSDLSSLSTDSTTNALLTGEEPSYETPLVGSPLAVCYFSADRPDDNNNKDDDKEEPEDSFHSLSTSSSSSSRSSSTSSEDAVLNLELNFPSWYCLGGRVG